MSGSPRRSKVEWQTKTFAEKKRKMWVGIYAACGDLIPAGGDTFERHFILSPDRNKPRSPPKHLPYILKLYQRSFYSLVITLQCRSWLRFNPFVTAFLSVMAIGPDPRVARLPSGPRTRRFVHPPAARTGCPLSREHTHTRARMLV